MTRQPWLLSSVLAVGLVAPLVGQAPKPAFEVASVKRRDPAAGFTPFRTPPVSARFYRPATTVASLILFAYELHDAQLIGGPDWIRNDQFEIDAKAAAPVRVEEQRSMVRSLLGERFRLVVHSEQRELRFSALVLARNDGRPGPNLTKCGEAEGPWTPRLLPRGAAFSALACAPISDIVRVLSRGQQAPVVDKTGLTGTWLHWLVYLDPALPPSAVADPDLASFPVALQEQLGLKLEPGRGPLDVLVVDSVEPPTEN
jgi:uncharacterized protein (TIGR03435 family)